MVITFSGTDGVGKSSQLERVMELLESEKIDYRVIYARGMCTPLVVKYKRIAAKLLARNLGSFGKYVSFGINLTAVELLFSWAVKLRLLSKANRVILCDRYIWDTFVDFSVRYPTWDPNSCVWKMLGKLIAKPDISIMYVASVSEIAKRLQEKGERAAREEIEMLQGHYVKISSNFDFVIDASDGVDSVFMKTKSALRLWNEESGYKRTDIT